MNNKLKSYLESVFAPYSGIKSIIELKSDLLADLEDRLNELLKEGKSEEEAFQMTIDSIGDIEETLEEMAGLYHKARRQIVLNFKATNMPSSVLNNISLREHNFSSSALQKSDFSGSDLSGSIFQSSDLSNTIYDKANLTDCVFKSNELKNASFAGSVLVRTKFSANAITNATFTNAQLLDAVIQSTDLGKAVFENCSLEGVKFQQTWLKDASFNGATLKNVSFDPSMLKAKYRKAMETVSFDGAKIDQPTLDALKEFGVDLSKAIMI